MDEKLYGQCIITVTTVLIACTGDPRVGLQCRDSNDCEGLVCYTGRCEVSSDRFSANVYVLGDDNEDAFLSPGESAGLRIEVERQYPESSNGKVTTLSNVVGTLATTQAGVTLANDTNLQFSDIRDGGRTCGTIPAVSDKGSCSSSKANYPTISLAPTVPANTVIPFRLTLKDAEGDLYFVYFTYVPPAIPQRFEVTSVSIVDDNNRDGILAPGESAGLVIHLKNSGASRAHAVVGTLSTSQQGLTVTNSTDLQFGNIYPGDTVCGTAAGATSQGSCSLSKAYYPNALVSTGFRAGTSIPFKLQLKDAYGNTAIADFSVWVR